MRPGSRQLLLRVVAQIPLRSESASRYAAVAERQRARLDPTLVKRLGCRTRRSAARVHAVRPPDWDFVLLLLLPPHPLTLDANRDLRPSLLLLLKYPRLSFLPYAFRSAAISGSSRSSARTRSSSLEVVLFPRAMSDLNSSSRNVRRPRTVVRLCSSLNAACSFSNRWAGCGRTRIF